MAGARAPTMNAKEKKKVCSRYIPDHLSFSILAKVPVKSFKRFSCVHKSWSLLIQNPNFINMFRNNLISKSHPIYDGDDVGLVLNRFNGPFEWSVYLISGDKFEKKVKLELPPSFQIPKGFGVTPIRVLGSAINGVICIYDCPGVHRTTAFWNPATEEIVIIPSGHAECIPEFATQIFPHGFGYDHVGDDYKVIQHVSHYIRANRNRLEENRLDDAKMPDPFWEIYSLKSNSWRKLDFDMPTIGLIFNSSVYFNGVCHWLGKAKTLIVSFQLCNEDYFITPSPFEDTDNDLEVSLIVLNDYIAIVTNSRMMTSFKISILGEFGVKDSWITLFNLELSACIEHPFGAREKGNIIFRREDGEVVCFDLSNGLIKEIGVKFEDKYWCQTAIYKKNLRLIGDIKM